MTHVVAGADEEGTVVGGVDPCDVGADPGGGSDPRPGSDPCESSDPCQGSDPRGPGVAPVAVVDPSAVRWLDDAEQQAWRAFLDGSSRLFERLGRVLDAAGLSLAEYEILVRLSEVEGRELRMSELAAAVVHSRSRLTHTVSRMESAGLLRRVATPDDRRGVMCRLTRAGEELLVSTAPAHVTSVREAFLDAMTGEEFLALGAAMTRVSERLREA